MGAAAKNRQAIDNLFTPGSVAVVGASGVPGKWGYFAAKQALRDKLQRDVFLVNRKGGEIQGEESYRRYSDIDAVPDLAVISVPQFAFEDTIDEVLAKGTRSIVAITAGFGEEGCEGRAVEERVVAKVREAGAVMLGPNCMGVYDGYGGIRCMPWADLTPGPVGFLSQSGGLIMDIAKRLAEVELGFSRVASVGNQADLQIPDLMENLVSDARTRIAAIYIEDLEQTDQLFESICETIACGREVILMTPYSSPGSVRAARAHTGSTVTSMERVRERTLQAGAWYVYSPREMVTVAQALLAPNRTAGTRVAVISDTGGPGVLCAGLAEKRGLEVREFSEALQEQLRGLLSPRAAVNNPVDLVDNITVEPMVDTLEAVLEADETDAVLMNIHVFVHESAGLEVKMGERIGRLAGRSGKPVVVTSHSMDAPGVLAALRCGVPVYRDTEEAAHGLALQCGCRRVR